MKRLIHTVLVLVFLLAVVPVAPAVAQDAGPGMDPVGLAPFAG